MAPATYRLMLATVAFLTIACSHVKATGMEIWAYDYKRAFNETLELGRCPNRIHRHYFDNGTHVDDIQRCKIREKFNGVEVHRNNIIDDVRNVEITKAEDLLAYMGLCSGDAAAFLGVLYSGDCMAVEIGKKLTFGRKTLVRAFVHYYRSSLDIMETDPNKPFNVDSYRDMGTWLKNRYYLKHLSYGTLEVAIVQIRFSHTKDAEKAKAIRLGPSANMSEYLREIKNRVGIPKRLMLINLSTARMKKFKVQRFKPLEHQEWERAFREVEILERYGVSTINSIREGRITPHLKYRFATFREEDMMSARLSNPLLWQQLSIMEVELQRGIALAKKTTKKCAENRLVLSKSADCGRIREMRRLLIDKQKSIHKTRIIWETHTEDNKIELVKNLSRIVGTYLRNNKRLAKDVEAAYKKEKMDRLKEKLSRKNEISTEVLLRRRIINSESTEDEFPKVGRITVKVKRVDRAYKIINRPNKQNDGKPTTTSFERPGSISSANSLQRPLYLSGRSQYDIPPPPKALARQKKLVYSAQSPASFSPQRKFSLDTSHKGSTSTKKHQGIRKDKNIKVHRLSSHKKRARRDQRLKKLRERCQKKLLRNKPDSRACKRYHKLRNMRHRYGSSARRRMRKKKIGQVVEPSAESVQRRIEKLPMIRRRFNKSPIRAGHRWK